MEGHMPIPIKFLLDQLTLTKTLQMRNLDWWLNYRQTLGPAFAPLFLNHALLNLWHANIHSKIMA